MCNGDHMLSLGFASHKGEDCSESTIPEAKLLDWFSTIPSFRTIFQFVSHQ